MYDLRLSQRWLWRMSSSGMWRCVDLTSTDILEESEPAWAGGSSRWFTARGFFYPEVEGDTFLRNVGWRKIYTAPHLKRRHSSSYYVYRSTHIFQPWKCDGKHAMYFYNFSSLVMYKYVTEISGRKRSWFYLLRSSSIYICLITYRFISDGLNMGQQQAHETVGDVIVANSASP
jgi:hypothetical protein